MNTLSPDLNRPPYRPTEDACTRSGKLMAFAVAAVALALIFAYTCEWVRVSYDRYVTLNQIMDVIAQFRAGIPPAYESYVMTAGSAMFMGVLALISCIALYLRKRSVGIVFLIVSLFSGLVTSYSALLSLGDASGNHSSPNATHILIVLLIVGGLVCSVVALVRLLKAGGSMGTGVPAGSGAEHSVHGDDGSERAEWDTVGEGNGPVSGSLFKWCLILSPLAVMGVFSALWAVMVYVALKNHKAFRSLLMLPLGAIAILPLIGMTQNVALVIVSLLLTGVCVVYFYEAYYRSAGRPGEMSGSRKLLYGVVIVCILLKVYAVMPDVRSDLNQYMSVNGLILLDYIVWFIAAFRFSKGIGKLVAAVE